MVVNYFHNNVIQYFTRMIFQNVKFDNEDHLKSNKLETTGKSWKFCSGISGLG